MPSLNRIFRPLPNTQGQYKQTAQEVLDSIEPPEMRRLNRRTFLKLINTSFIALVIPACGNPGKIDLQRTTREPEFQQLFNVIFPAAEKGLERFTNQAMLRIHRLSSNESRLINNFYRGFKLRLWIKSYFGWKPYTRKLGEAVISDQLSSFSDQNNKALDIIYRELSLVEGLAASVWGRRVSLFDEKCAYWDNYDQPVR